MGRTYKRDPDQDDFDDLALIDDTDDDDLLDWMNRPNEARPRADAAGRRGHRAAAARSSYRALPDDWRDFDYGDDSGDAIWR